MSSISSSKVISPTAYARKEYGIYSLSANQTTDIANTNPIKFNTVLSGNIAFNPATYTWTLKANKTYKLMTIVSSAHSAAGYMLFAWKDITNSVTLSNVPENLTVSGPHNETSSNTAMCIVTPTTDINVQVLIANPVNLTSITASETRTEITEIETFSPMVQTYQYAYVSPQITLSVTGVGVTSFVVVRAKGTFYKTSDGIWHLRFNIHATHDVDTSFSYRIAGIVGIYGFRQACAFSQATTGAAVYEWCYLNGNSGDISIATNANVANTQVSGDIELGAKPTGYALPSDV